MNKHKLLAWHNDPAVKQKYIERVRTQRAHWLADNLVNGVTWEKRKGYAVGCTLEKYDHSQFPNALGFPVWLAYLENRIFQGLENKKAQLWPERFMSAIPIGVELEKIKKPFLIWLLSFVLMAFDNERFKEQAGAIKNIIELYKNDCQDLAELRKAADAVEDAFRNSPNDSAAAYAVYAAHTAYAAHTVAGAFGAPAHAANGAADAFSASSDSAYTDAAYAAAWEKIANHLIYLIENLADKEEAGKNE